MPVPSVDQIVQSMTYQGLKWSGQTITFSIPGVGSVWNGYPDLGGDWKEYWGNEPRRPGFGFLSTEQAEVFRGYIAAYDRLIAPRLVETDDAVNVGQIRVAFVDASPWGGYATPPPASGQAGEPVNGDIWLDDSWKARTLEVGWNLGGGQSPVAAVLHEIGHALGLKHPFEAPTVLGPEYDSTRYTLMSYDSALDVETLSFSRSTDPRADIFVRGERVAVDTPMVFDILAVQSIYGADPDTNAGATRYQWAEGKAFLTSIYDAGGIDTIDTSSHLRASNIDLTPGAYSSISIYSRDAQEAYWRAQFPDLAASIAREFDNSMNHGILYQGRDNLGIAYSTTIENVTAGAGSDTITGNAANNDLAGNAGADRILGNLGNDSISGGDGDDFLRGEEGDDSILGGAGFDDMHGNMGRDTLLGGQGSDWVVGGKDEDLLRGEAGDDLVYGNMGADTLWGGEGADTMLGGQDNDTLSGESGADFLSGDRGDDTISGGLGADTFYAFVGGGTDLITDFHRLEGDQIRLDVGTTYSVSFVGADTVVSLRDAQVVLVGVSSAELTDEWIVLV